MLPQPEITAELAHRLVTSVGERREHLAGAEKRLHQASLGHLPGPSRPGISVIIPTYQGRDRITHTLDSLAAQDLGTELFEVVIVANGPADGTVEVVEDWAKRHDAVDVRVLKTATSGAGGARNIGLSAACRAYVTFVDDDDTVGPTFLSAMFSVAAPDVIATTRLIDVHVDGTTSESTAMSARMRDLEDRPDGVFLTSVPRILGFNACKLIARHHALRARYQPALRSGEDVAYMAHLLGVERLRVVPAPGGVTSAYRRSVRPGSVSRRDLDFDFAVLQRLEVIAELEQVPAPPSTRAALGQLVRSQAGFIRSYLEAEPGELEAVRRAVEESRVRDFPWQVVNHGKADDLALLYCFAPFNDPSSVVASKALAERDRIVDVVLADMSDIRQRDPSLEVLSKYWIDRRAIVPAAPRFTDWDATCEFAQRAVARAEQWAAEKPEGYKNLYTRALWAGSHVAGALYKLAHPQIRWTAEFSDPLGRGIDAQRRVGPLTSNEVTTALTDVLTGASVTVPEDLTFFELVELATYALADDLVFTNENQRDYMLSLVPERLAAASAGKSRVRPHPSPIPQAYSAFPTTYELDSGVRNIAYFGSFYGSRTLNEVLGGMGSLSGDERSRLRLHVFCNKPEELEGLVAGCGLESHVRVNPYLEYMEFLNASTRFDVLLVQDAETRGTFEKNPFLPSKYSDYVGSGTAIWGVVEPGSPLSGRPLDHLSRVGDPEGAAEVLRSIASGNTVRA